ncbi:acyl transferase/acyl hydrolase/lysophospholipase [Xylaria palmicola]|nr:acyl transferase/acyl hydrolase/lysophospholipase [Xylaria palmicola]
MLGRLGMTVDECIRAYENVGRAAFTPKLTFLPIAPPKGAFSAKALEAAVKKVVRGNCTERQCVTKRRQGQPTVDTCPHDNLMLQDTRCTKTVILAITKANVDTRPTLFTTYDSSAAFQDCTIWQAARATSAAATFFKSIELGRDNVEFIDAAFGYNNPCEVLIEEAKKQFPGHGQLQVLSIGTGLGDVVTIEDSRGSILKALKKMASSSAAVANRLDDRYGNGGSYFRFNVDRGLEDITLSDWQKTSKISAHTMNYIQGNKRTIQKFVDDLLFGPKRQQSDVPELREPSSFHPVFYIPFLQNKKFVGQEDVLDTLQQKLFYSQDCRTLAIFGRGGVGKTQVVLQFAYWVKQNQPEYSIFWIPAYAEESFEKAYLDIAKKAGILIDSDKEDPKITVRNYLSSEDVSRWLLIIDNADDQEIIRGPSSIYDYLPESHNGLTIFTTRSPELAQSVAGGDQIELNKMDAQDAQRLLENSVIRKQLLQDTTLTRELLEELTYLPLAIMQAAAYLNQNLKHHYSPIKRYLELLRSTEEDLVHLMSTKFHDKTQYQDSQKAVATTWLVSFEQIQKNHPTAADLLSFISCIEPKAIPRSLLPRLGSKAITETAIGILSGYAFLESHGARDTYDMHSLVHLATRIWIQEQARIEEITINAIRHVNANFPLPDPDNRPVWQIYFPHAFRLLSRNEASEIEERYDLCFQVGRCLYEDRRFNEAIRYLEKTANWNKAYLLDNNSDRLASEHTLASAYLNNKQTKEAIEILEHVAEIKKTMFNEKDHSRLVSEHMLASAYLSNKQTKEAIEILEHVVEIEKTMFNEKDHSRLACERTLASAYLNNKQTKEAIEILEHVVEIEKTMLNEKDHSRLASEHGLAYAYLETGRAQEAVDLFEHVVRIRKTTLDEKDHDRLASEHTLACAYLETGRAQEAVDLLEHVVRIRKTTLDEKDYNRLASEHMLAYAYLTTGRAQEAVDLLEHVVLVESQLYDQNDPERHISLDLLREAQTQLEAESKLERRE